MRQSLERYPPPVFNASPLNKGEFAKNLKNNNLTAVVNLEADPLVQELF